MARLALVVALSGPPLFQLFHADGQPGTPVFGHGIVQGTEAFCSHGLLEVFQTALGPASAPRRQIAFGQVAGDVALPVAEWRLDTLQRQFLPGDDLCRLTDLIELLTVHGVGGNVGTRAPVEGGDQPHTCIRGSGLRGRQVLFSRFYAG